MGGAKTYSAGRALMGEKMINSVSYMLRITENKKFQNMMTIFFAVILAWVIGRNIPYLCTVLELGDEAGYLQMW